MKRFFSVALLGLLLCTWILPAAQAAALTDLEQHWSAGDVGKLIERGAVGGYPDGTFRPDATITRAEFAKILRQSLSLASVGGNDFADTANHWAVTDIHTLVSNQILVPAEYGSLYGPDGAITRREIAIMLVRAMGLNDSATALSGQATAFADDANIQSYDKGYLYLAKELGLVGGYEDGSFQPNNKATRAEACVMVVRLLKLKGLDLSDSGATTVEQPDTVQPSGDPAANQPTSDGASQTSNQVTYQLSLQNSQRSNRNALNEQYVYATLQLIVQNKAAQAVTISDQNLKTIVTYNGGAQVTASQSSFSQTIAAGSSKTITTTVNLLLPNNQVANMVLGNQISQIQVQLLVDNQTLTFSAVDQALLQAVQ